MATRGYIGETLEFLDQIMRERKMARDHVEGAMACMGWAGPLGATPGRGRGSDNSSERVESSPGRRRAVARDKTAEDGRGLIKSAEARQGPACSLLLETRVDENGVRMTHMRMVKAGKRSPPAPAVRRCTRRLPLELLRSARTL